MLKSEAFCGQLIKIAHGAYKGSVGIIYRTALNAARVLLASKEAKEDWGSLYYVEYADMCTCQQKLDTKLKKSGIKNESMYKIHQLF